MLQHRDDDEVEDELDDGDDSEVSSDEEVYYQTVAVGGRSGRHGAGGGATISRTVFEILTLIGRKWLILLTPPLFDAPAQGNPLEFLDETYPRKTRGMGLLYGENCMILASAVFD